MTDIKPGDQVTDHGSLSIQSSNGNTVTRNADGNTPAQGNTNGGKPFPAPRQSAPITRPPDTAREREEANLSIEEQVKLAEQRDKDAEGGDTGKATIHGHTNGEPVTQPAGQLMDLREEVKDREVSPEKQPTHEASVGGKRGRDEEPAGASDEQQADAENGKVKKDTPAAAAPEPEPKKPRVEAEVTDPTAPSSTELDQTKPVETAEPSERAPKKKAGRPKKEETKAVTGERKNSVSSRTRSKANAEDVSI
ncbi:uncharacterized protein DFL_004638 [Arthrobotrys flagrans]|uniref:Hypervirulence associated protein TUDOR domain-containing protein n=1 Tax=Arthrobotrys flagrans TaxID=97331 RepID=A0A437A5N9_ARTFL|nr:hypothetical protein DFL_004638 [Arthrobotrys flagrans]